MVEPVTLDLSFLDVDIRPPARPDRPVNVFDILNDGWRENRVDMTLQFFLDPTERHGLGPLVMDALLRTVDGSHLIGTTGRTSGTFNAEDHAGSDAWEVQTQADYIDVYAVNPELDLVVVIENKIGHALHNPLDEYARRALARAEVTAALVIVLAPETRMPDEVQEQWLSRSVTYADLNREIRNSPALLDRVLAPADSNQRRALELLAQFIEAREGDKVDDLDDEAVRLDEWRALLDEHDEAIKRFDASRRAIRRMLRGRRRRLEGMLADRIEVAGLRTSWEAHGAENHGQDHWNAYCFVPEDWSIELKFSSLPDRPAIYTYDYPGRTYKNTRQEALGISWSATDEEIADAFMKRVDEILTAARKGDRIGTT
jgi:hypothetical protein